MSRPASAVSNDSIGKTSSRSAPAAFHRRKERPAPAHTAEREVASDRHLPKRRDPGKAREELVAAVRDGLSREAGARDAARALAEAKSAELAKEKAALIEAESVRKLEQADIQMVARYSRVFFNCRDPTDAEEVRVASTINTLPRNLIAPHRVCEAHFLRCEIEREAHLIPQLASVAMPPDGFVTARYEVRIHSFGVLGAGPEILAQPDIGIPVELLLLAQSRRVAASTRFSDTLKRWSALASFNPNFKRDQYQMAHDGIMADRVATALLLLEAWPLDSKSLNIDLACAFGTQTIELLKNDLPHGYFGEPTAPGFYVKGYTVGLNDAVPGLTADRLHKAAGFAVSKAKSAIRKARSWRHARLAPVSIDGFLPTFPDPFDEDTARAGFVKRLAMRPPPYEGALFVECCRTAQALAENVSRHARTFDEADFDAMIDEACAKHPWTDDDRVEFAKGARCAGRCIFENHEGSFRDFELAYVTCASAFLKAETMPHTKIAAPRYIIAPKPWLKGFLFAVLHPPEEAILEALDSHVVKHKTPREVTTALRDSFAGQENVVENDFSHFESQKTPERQFNWQLPVYTAAVSQLPFKRALTRIFTTMCQRGLIIGMPFGWLVTPSQTHSGWPDTSIGNLVTNAVFTTTGIRILCTPHLTPEEWLAKWSLPWFIEGDDGIYALPPGYDAASLAAMMVREGAECKMEAAMGLEQAHFCGNRLMIIYDDVTGEIFRLKEPFEALTRVLSTLGCNADTLKHDFELMVAKARSYLLEFPNTPVLTEACAMIIAYYGAADAGVRTLLRAQEPELELVDMGSTPVVSFLRSQSEKDPDFLRRYASQESDAVEQAALVTEQAYEAHANMLHVSSERLRQMAREVAEQLPKAARQHMEQGVSVARARGDAIAGSISGASYSVARYAGYAAAKVAQAWTRLSLWGAEAGARVCQWTPVKLECPTIAQYWNEYEAARRMRVQEFDGKREASLSKLSSIRKWCEDEAVGKAVDKAFPFMKYFRAAFASAGALIGVLIYWYSWFYPLLVVGGLIGIFYACLALFCVALLFLGGLSPRRVWSVWVWMNRLFAILLFVGLAAFLRELPWRLFRRGWRGLTHYISHASRTLLITGEAIQANLRGLATRLDENGLLIDPSSVQVAQAGSVPAGTSASATAPVAAARHASAPDRKSVV